jgi:biotin carboxyl carrier protein
MDIQQDIEVNLEELLMKYRENPFEEIPILTPHTGLINFKVKKGDDVKGVEGQWNHIPGTLLFIIDREKNTKKITSPTKGKISAIKTNLEGSFIEAGEQVMIIKKLLEKKEVIERVLTTVLHPFNAKDDARYYMIPELTNKMESGKNVAINNGDEAIIMSLMKRDTIIKYEGVSGVIYSVYFGQGELVEKGKPLLGICPMEKLSLIEKIIERINLEWDNALVCHRA